VRLYRITVPLTGPPPVSFDFRNEAIGGSASNALLCPFNGLDGDNGVFHWGGANQISPSSSPWNMPSNANDLPTLCDGQFEIHVTESDRECAIAVVDILIVRYADSSFYCVDVLTDSYIRFQSRERCRWTITF
jgi:hypothetical protein